MNISPHSRRLGRLKTRKQRETRTARVAPVQNSGPPIQSSSPPTGNVGGLIRGLRENYTPPRAIPVNLPTLKSGQRGNDVKMLQEVLNRQGAGLKVDGMMGPRTLAAVRKFQRDARLSPDGIVGSKTWAALHSQPQQSQEKIPRARVVPEPTANKGGRVQHPSPRASAEQRLDHYKGLLAQQGVKVQPGRTYVLGMRGLSPDGDRSNTHDGNSLRRVNRKGTRYNDSFVVLRPNRNGQHDTFVLRGATYPGQGRSSKSPDANGDGVGDVGMVRPGTYRVKPNGEFYGAPSFHVQRSGGSGRIPGWRDTNHDGAYSAQERQRSAARGNTMSGILFHQGDPGSPNSIGCQTLSPEDFQKFIRAVGGEKASFTYTLMEAY